VIVRTRSAEETRLLAADVAGVVRSGDVVLLAGELGSGKTVFAQGFGRALGVEETITSPTFTLVHSYRGRVPFHHADVYRLDQLQEAIDLALPELLDEGGVALVEWGDSAAQAFSPDYLWVRIDLDEAAGEECRRLTFRPVGPSWSARVKALHHALAKWSGTEAAP